MRAPEEECGTPALAPALDALFTAHWLRLVRLAVLLVDDRGLAEDVVQDAFAGLHRHWDRLEDTDRAGAYLAPGRGQRLPLGAAPAPHRARLGGAARRADVVRGGAGAARGGAAWLVPDGWDAADLTRRGLAEAAPSLWLPRDAVGSADDVFSALRRPPGALDLPVDTAVAAGIEPGAERVLAQTDGSAYWVATNPAGEACVVVQLPQSETAASSYQEPLAAAVGGLWVSTTAGSVSVEAHIVPDGWSTAGWEEEGLVPLAAGLWVGRATGEQAALEQVAAAATDPIAVAPPAATGTQELQVPVAG